MNVKREKRKRQVELLQSSPKSVKSVKQSKLCMSPSCLEDAEVNEAWGKAFFSLDIPVNKVSTPAFRDAIAATKRSKPTYKGPDRHKLYGPVLERLYHKCTEEQKRFLAQRTGYGRAITGDGATILGTKFINFLCHEKGKGVMLCKIKDCTKRLAEVGSIQATFIAHELIDTIRRIGPTTVYLVVIDGGADWVAAQAMVRDKFPWIYFIHCVAHEGSLILKDICAIDEVFIILIVGICCIRS